jgi:hypothetical protein
MEDVTKVQKKRLVDVLRSMRPWVALRLAEMRHYSPERWQHILRTLPKDVWKKARYRRPFSPKEMEFITRHCAEMCTIEEPILHRATSADIIEQTSNVVLASKGANVDPRMCINYVYLNSQMHAVAGEIKNLDEALRQIAGNLRFNSTDGFSGFYTISLDKNTRHLTAFVVPDLGVFYWLYMPFGLQGAPFTYTTLIFLTFTGIQGEKPQVYLDNVETGAGKTLPLKSD